MAKATPTLRPLPPLLPFLSVLALLLCPLPLRAQIEWTPEEQISLDDVYDDWFPRIAAGPDGRVWVVWQGSDGYDPEIMYSVNDGSGWSYPDRVNTDDYAEDSLPDIVVGPDDNPWVVWGKNVGGSSKLYWSRWEGDGWRQEERMFPALGEEEPPAVASMATEYGGTPWVAWSWPGPGTGRMACCSRWQNGAWGPPDTLLASSGAAGCLLAGGPDGRMWAVVSQTVGGEKTIFCTYWQEGVWAPNDTLPDTLGAMSLAVTAQGAVWLAWHRDGLVWVAQRAGDGWGDPELAVVPSSTPFDSVVARAAPVLAATPDGVLWAVWMGFRIGVGEYNVGTCGAQRVAGQWSSEQRISSEFGMSQSRPGIAYANGFGSVVWQAWDGRDFEILLSHSVGSVVNDQPVEGRSSEQFVWAPNPMRSDGCLWARGASTIDGSMALFDAAGRLVAGIESRPGTAGMGTRMQWDGQDARGVSVPAGAYIWRVHAGGQKHEGRIVVIR